MNKTWEWGMNGHNKYYRAYPEKYQAEQIKLAADLGCKIYSMNFNPITEADFEYMDSVVAAVLENGMELMLITDQYDQTAEQDAEKMRRIAERYKKGSPHGFIKYLRIYGEQDCGTLIESNNKNGILNIGQKQEHYLPEILDWWYEKMNATINAIKSVNTDSKVVVSIAHLHFGFLLGMRERGLKWDVLGLDWYEDMGPFSELLTPAKELFPEYPLMICEANLRPECDHANAPSSRWQWLYEGMEYCYNDPRVIGFLFYELLDEVYFVQQITETSEITDENRFVGTGGSMGGVLSGTVEGYVGFVTCSADGEIGKPKAVYHDVKKLIEEKYPNI